MEESIGGCIDRALEKLLSNSRGTLYEEISKRYDQIMEARSRGFSLQTIATALTQEGAPISRNVLHNYLKRIAATGRKPGMAAKRSGAKVSASSDFSAAMPNTDVKPSVQQPVMKSIEQTREIGPTNRQPISNLNHQPLSRPEPLRSTPVAPITENGVKKVSWLDLLAVAPSTPLPEVQLPLSVNEDGMPEVPPHDQFEVKSLDETEMVTIYRIVISNKKLGTNGQFFFRLLPGINRDLPFGTNFNGVPYDDAYLVVKQPISAKIIGVNT